MTGKLYIGSAGWALPKARAAQFPGQGTHLERYARCLDAVEINSSFYRPHRPQTYVRWAASVPTGFRFAVKVPKLVTHSLRLERSEEPLARFLSQVAGLGEKLGPLLVQLPPSLAYDVRRVDAFFSLLRERFSGSVVCEPRHRTWFSTEAEKALVRFGVARVAADPAILPQAARPGGDPGVVYYRLHGSPKMYVSAYSAKALATYTKELERACARGAETWCLFDNTTLGAALTDALTVHAGLATQRLSA